ncbi:MAG: ribonuclease Z [Mangrovibacterium sp.]
MPETFQLTILGSSSATPTSERYPTAQVLQVPGRSFLIDCGEGTQLQLRRNRINFSRISHVLISHLHGDHFFGLIGLISSFHLLGRKNELHIFSHSELQRYIRFQLEFLGMEDPGFRLIFHPLNFKHQQRIWEDNRLSIRSFPLNHRVPCCGFRIDEKPKQPNLIKTQLDKYAIPISERKKIKAGGDFLTTKGERIPNNQLVIPARKPRSYAYCSDTTYNEITATYVQEVDLLYHEATFAGNYSQTASATGHSTASDAARIARLARARKLLIGHFSSRYKDTSPLLAEARSIFPATYAVSDNETYLIG